MSDQPLFREIVETHVLPMFPGTRIVSEEASSRHRQRVAFENPCRLRLSNNRRHGIRITVERSQPFQKSDGRIIDDMLQLLLANLDKETPGILVRDVLKYSHRRAISRSIDQEIESLLVTILDHFGDWAEQTYEGNRIASGIGILRSANPSTVKLEHVLSCDFSKVLANGVETLLTCSRDGHVIGHELLMAQTPENTQSPHRLGRVAEWATNSRIGIVLSRNGETLIFQNGELRFAKRRGAWRHFTHDPVIIRIRRGNRQVREAVYATALDVSFARTGGCLAVIQHEKLSHVQSHVIKPDESVATGNSTKATCLRQVTGEKFQNIPRALRQELAGIDGALILDRQGNIVDIGSIVRIAGGSTGGGRLAATKELSKHGVAIKISADGAIQGFISGVEQFNVG